MFTSNVFAALIIAATPALAAESPHLGQPVSPSDMAAWDISVDPSGANLPPGRGTAKEGAVVYSERCIACHGEKGEGKPNDRLVGGIGSLKGDQPTVRTVGSYWPYATTMFDYVRRAMPLEEPQSLTPDQVYAVIAYVLSLNGIVGETDVIDAKTLPKVKMPARDSFYVVYPNKLE